MTRKNTTLAVAALLLLSTVAAAPAMAQDTEPDVSITSVLNAVYVDLKESAAEATGFDDKTEADPVTVAENWETEVNEHKADWLKTTNANSEATTSIDNIKVVFRNEDTGEKAVRHVTADVNDSTGNYTDVQVVGSTSDDADVTFTLTDDALSDATSQTQKIYEDYVSGHEIPPRSALVERSGTYCADIEIEGDTKIECPSPTSEISSRIPVIG